jgi:C_GCAxxG_C_C family probable redox protein
MTAQQEKALSCFNNGLNCGQAVLVAFCEKYGLSQELALKMAGGLGSGFRSGDVCGAVSGGVLVVGLKYGQCTADDKQAKLLCYAKTEEFIAAFRSRHGSICCRDIIGCDLSTPEGREQANREGLFASICTDKVKSAIELLIELGY